MDLRVLITTAGPETPSPGLPITVEVRDTSHLDVAATTVASAHTRTGEIDAGDATFAEDTLGHQPVATVNVRVPKDLPEHASLTVWARVAAEDTDHVTAGDWITVQSYPVNSGVIVVDVVAV